MNTQDMGIEALKLVAEKAELALDGCLAKIQVLETKITMLFRANLLVALSTVGLLITTTGAMAHFLPSLILFIGSLIVAAILLFATTSLAAPIPGSMWSDFESYKSNFGNENEQLYRYLIQVYLYKLEIARNLNENRANLLNISLWVMLCSIAGSTGVFCLEYFKFQAG